jgi:putative ABC transport system substrate-binding protein
VDRRCLLKTVVGAAPGLLGVSTRAQPRAGKPARIGILGSTTAEGFAPRWAALRAELRALGHVEGRDLVYEERFADDRHERLPQLAAELAALPVDVIVTHGIPGTRAARRATSTIPIVMASVADPVAAGLVQSFARPEVNVTGMSFLTREMAVKRIELIKEAVPRLATVGVISNPRNAAFSEAMAQAMLGAAQALALRLEVFEASDVRDYPKVVGEMAARRVDAMAVTEEATLNSHVTELAALALRHRLPSVGSREYANAGGLIGYGADLVEMFRRAAGLVDRILRGARARDLPVEQPNAVELVLNVTTSRALGISFPNTMRLRATTLI